jgi:hypothetical protein
MDVRQKKQSAKAASESSGERVGRASGIAAAAAQIAANEYCLLNYGTSYIGGIPCRLSLPNEDLWIVPAVLTSPGYGAVGIRAVDALSGKVVGATPQLEVRAAGVRLAQEHRHEIDAAFRLIGAGAEMLPESVPDPDQ